MASTVLSSTLMLCAIIEAVAVAPSPENSTFRLWKKDCCEKTLHSASLRKKQTYPSVNGSNHEESLALGARSVLTVAGWCFNKAGGLKSQGLLLHGLFPRFNDTATGRIYSICSETQRCRSSTVPQQPTWSLECCLPAVSYSTSIHYQTVDFQSSVTEVPE